MERAAEQWGAVQLDLCLREKHVRPGAVPECCVPSQQLANLSDGRGPHIARCRSLRSALFSDFLVVVPDNLVEIALVLLFNKGRAIEFLIVLGIGHDIGPFRTHGIRVL